MTETADQYVQVMTTVDSEPQARLIARLAVESRLAACGQVAGPVHSIYHWQGRVEEATEFLCILKSIAAHYPALERLIKQNHPYTVPEILAVPVSDANPDYLAWLSENILPPSSGR